MDSYLSDWFISDWILFPVSLDPEAIAATVSHAPAPLKHNI
ncbi:hypothetical protein [Azotosporobacter soli]